MPTLSELLATLVAAGRKVQSGANQATSLMTAGAPVPSTASTVWALANAYTPATSRPGPHGWQDYLGDAASLTSGLPPSLGVLKSMRPVNPIPVEDWRPEAWLSSHTRGVPERYRQLAPSEVAYHNAAHTIRKRTRDATEADLDTLLAEALPKAVKPAGQRTPVYIQEPHEAQLHHADIIRQGLRDEGVTSTYPRLREGDYNFGFMDPQTNTFLSEELGNPVRDRLYNRLLDIIHRRR